MALRAQAERYADWLSTHAEVDWADVLGTAALHRTHFAARASVSARDAAEATAALRALGEGRSHAAVSLGAARERGRVVFVFPGQGSQWTSMGRALLAESPVFAETVAACEAALSRHTDWSLTAVLRGDEGAGVPPLERVDVVAAGAVCDERGTGGGVAKSRVGAGGGGGAQPGRDSGGGGRWHFITGRGRSGGGAAQPVAEAGERQRRDGGDGACGRGRGRAAAGVGVVGFVVGGGEHAELDGGLGPERSGGALGAAARRGRRVLPTGECGLRLAQRRDGPDLVGVGKCAFGPRAAGWAGADGVDGDGSALRGDNAGRSILVPEPAADGASGPRAGGADW